MIELDWLVRQIFANETLGVEKAEAGKRRQAAKRAMSASFRMLSNCLDLL